MKHIKSGIVIRTIPEWKILAHFIEMAMDSDLHYDLWDTYSIDYQEFTLDSFQKFLYKFQAEIGTTK